MNKLILLRHGQSQWNLENRFTGWKDVSLTDLGKKEAIRSGRLLKKHNILIDIVFCSVLRRAIETAKLAIAQTDLDQLWDKENELIMFKDKALNERNYGELVGLNKQETADKFGKDQVHIWRRSYDVPPPGGESLKEVVLRVQPYFENIIEPEINNNKNILIAAHGNSLRAVMIRMGLYQPEEISNIEIPTGSPFVINYVNGKIIDSEYLV